MHLCMVILALSALFKPAAAIPFKDDYSTVNVVKELLKNAYSMINFKNNSDVIVILGDVGEKRGFLRDPNVKTAPNHEYFYKFPSFDVDRRTGTLIVDLPAFIDERNVSTILTSAFVNKIIFDRAKRIKILLLMPRNYQKAFKLMVEVAAKLAEMNLGHFNAFTKSIGVIGTRRKRETSRFMLEELKYVLEEALDFAMRSDLPGVSIVTHLLNQNAIATIRRPPNSEQYSEELRNFIFNKLDFTQVQGGAKIAVDAHIREYVRQKFYLLIDDLSLRNPTASLIDAVVKHDCESECKIISANFETLRKCCTALVRIETMTQVEKRNYIRYLSQWKPGLWSQFDFELEKFVFLAKLID